MMAAGFIPECISDLIEAEAAIDDGLNAARLNGSNELRLMLAAAYYQALKPNLSGHQVSGRDLTGSATIMMSAVSSAAITPTKISKSRMTSAIVDSIVRPPTNAFRSTL